MANKFPIGAWVYHPIKELPLSEVDKWADMGLTVTMSPWVDARKEDELELLKAFLDKAAERDMKLILPVTNIGYDSDYETGFTQIYNRYKGHPALYGFFVSDEPSNTSSSSFLASTQGDIVTVRPMSAHLSTSLNGNSFMG